MSHTTTSESLTSVGSPKLVASNVVTAMRKKTNVVENFILVVVVVVVVI
jgi:hypothetical protein